MGDSSLSDQVLTTERVAAMLGCAISTVQEHARTGYLPGLLFGDGGYVFPVEALLCRLNELAVEQSVERRQPKKTKAVQVGAPITPRGLKPVPQWMSDLKVHASS